MRKSVIGVFVAASVAMPAVAEKPTYDNPRNENFETRGACESAIKHERNERRATKDDKAALNEKFRENWYCEEQEDGTWTARNALNP